MDSDRHPTILKALCSGVLKRQQTITSCHTPSISSGGGPALPCLGVFIKSGKTVRRPRMSTNFWQLSVPSTPVIAWFNTFIPQLRDIFFSLVHMVAKEQTWHVNNRTITVYVWNVLHSLVWPGRTNTSILKLTKTLIIKEIKP